MKPFTLTSQLVLVFSISACSDPTDEKLPSLSPEQQSAINEIIGSMESITPIPELWEAETREKIAKGDEHLFMSQHFRSLKGVNSYQDLKFVVDNDWKDYLEQSEINALSNFVSERINSIGFKGSDRSQFVIVVECNLDKAGQSQTAFVRVQERMKVVREGEERYLQDGITFQTTAFRAISGSGAGFQEAFDNLKFALDDLKKIMAP